MAFERTQPRLILFVIFETKAGIFPALTGIVMALLRSTAHSEGAQAQLRHFA